MLEMSQWKFLGLGLTTLQLLNQEMIFNSWYVAHKTTAPLVTNVPALNDGRRPFDTNERLTTCVSNLRTDRYGVQSDGWKPVLT